MELLQLIRSKMKQKRYFCKKVFKKGFIGNKAQLSTEYMIVVGMIIVVLMPFFLSFSGVIGNVGRQLTADAVKTLADTSFTVSNLGEGSRLKIPVKVSNVAKNYIDGTGYVSLEVSGNKIEARASRNTVSSQQELLGDRAGPVSVAAVPYGVIIGDGPAITCLGLEDQSNDIELCDYPLEIGAGNRFRIFGGFFDEDDTVVEITRVGGGSFGRFSIDVENENVIKVNPASTSPGSYIVKVKNTETGFQSFTKSLTVVTGKKK